MMQSEQLIIGSKYKPLLEHAISNAIWIPDNPYVDERLSGHADLSVFVYDECILFALKYLESYINIPECEFIDEIPGKKYPKDAIMNCCSIGDTVFVNKKSISKEIYRYFCEGDTTIIKVNQGYCKCNILPINNFAFITSDYGIYREAIKNYYDVLLIKPGFIELEGFDYGFIGGSGFVDKGCVAFTGFIDNHPDYDAIKSFCLNYHLGIEYLTCKPIFDIGSIIKVRS